MLSDTQRSEFQQRGIVRLPGAIALRDIEKMRDRLWQDIEQRHEMSQADPDTWRAGRPSGFQKISRSDAFDATHCQAVREAADEILGPNHTQPWTQPLVNFPTKGEQWTIPHAMWHLDLPATALDEVPGLRVFTFLDEVVARGGGTAVVIGSHRVVQCIVQEADEATRLSSRKIRDTLRRSEPWIEALFSAGDPEQRTQRFMNQDTSVRGIPVRVVEITGEPGDVVLMDLRMLHSLTPNVQRRPRLVLGQVIFRR